MPVAGFIREEHRRGMVEATALPEVFVDVFVTNLIFTLPRPAGIRFHLRRKKPDNAVPLMASRD
jgi:hypothetical protein